MMLHVQERGAGKGSKHTGARSGKRVPVPEYHGRHRLTIGSESALIHRRVLRTGTMPSTSPLRGAVLP